MPKKRNPEEMIQRILDTSLELFRTKGYEETTILDIVNAMEVSRGAFYHHFKSKEEVLFAILERKEMDEAFCFEEILTNETLTGIEKLRKLLAHCIESAFIGQDAYLTTALLTLMKEPKILSNQLKEIQNTEWLLPVIKEGIRDGTIHENDPYVLAELISLLVNFWLLPTIFPGDHRYAKAKVVMIKEVLDGLGCPLLDEELLGLLMKIVQEFPL